MKRILTLATVLAAALGLASCGEQKDTLSASPGSAQTLRVMLDWFPNADHVGLYQAIADGGFRRAALNVHVETPSDPATPLKLLAAGKIDVAISYEPEVLLARNEGEPLVSIGAIVQEPLTSIVSIGSKGISSPAQLRGKTVGDAGISYQHAYLRTILTRAGVPDGSVKEMNVGSNLVPALLSGRVNAVLGAYWNYEAIQLAQQRKSPHVIHMDQVGVPPYDELVIVVRRATIADHPEAIRRFVQALGRGYESVRRDPTAGVQNLVKASPGLDPKLQLASVKATLPAFFPGGSHPWGWQDPARWNAYGLWMLHNHLIANQSAIVDASTNELLAGQGVG
jgi:putative hydroxymethylpyrimidine transport system substrate-binding protein